MKAPLLFSLLTGLLLAGLADGLSGLQARLEATQANALVFSLSQETGNGQAEKSHATRAAQSRMGSEAAAAEEISMQGQSNERQHVSPPEVSEVQQLFKTAGSDVTTLKLRGNAGERYSIEIFDISGHKVLHREGILAG